MPKGVLVDLTRCIGCRGCQVACKSWNERPVVKTAVSGSLREPAGAERGLLHPHPLRGGGGGRGAGLELRQGAVPALQGAGLRLGLPRRGAGQDRERAGGLRLRQVHRLPLLHGGLPVRHPEVRVEQVADALGAEVHLLRRAAGGQPVAGLREDLPDRRAALGRGRRSCWPRRRSGWPPASTSSTSTARRRPAGPRGSTSPTGPSRRSASTRRCRSTRSRRTPGRRSRRSRWRSSASSAVLGGLAYIRNRGSKGGE